MVISVLLACHNRRDTTLQCLKRLHSQTLPESTTLDIYLVDDGSADGTSDAVKEEFPNVKVMAGDGNLFIYGALRIAWDEARRSQFDYLLLLNDDIVLDVDAISESISWSSRMGKSVVLGGAMRDPKTSEVTYSGFDRPSFHRVRMHRILPKEDDCTPVEALNGNFILVPAAAAIKLHNFAPYVIQKLGDIELTLRANRIGLTCALMPGTVGTCPFNPRKSREDGLRALRYLMRRNELPPSVLLPFCREHAGRLWPLWFLSAYVAPMIKGY